MAIRVKCKEIDTEYSFVNACAFVDTEGDFYLIDEDCETVVRLTHAGCVAYKVDNYESINDFLDAEFGDCKVARIYSQGNEYEIIVNG